MYILCSVVCYTWTLPRVVYYALSTLYFSRLDFNPSGDHIFPSTIITRVSYYRNSYQHVGLSVLVLLWCGVVVVPLSVPVVVRRQLLHQKVCGCVALCLLLLLVRCLSSLALWMARPLL